MRWLLLVPGAVVLRALRIRLSVGPRRRQWADLAATSAVTCTPDLGTGPADLRLLALGDSLTQGIGSSQLSTSWLGRFALNQHYRTGRAVRIANRSVYGAKIADLITGQLPVPAGTDLVTMCIGANDAGRTAPEQFRTDLRRVCRELPPRSIIGDVPEFQWGPRIAAAAELSQVVRDVVAEFPELILAEVERHTVGTRIFTELAGDFFHPGDPGHLRIADAFITAAGGR